MVRQGVQCLLILQQIGGAPADGGGIERRSNRDAGADATADALALIARDGHGNARSAARDGLQQRRTPVRNDETGAAHQLG